MKKSFDVCIELEHSVIPHAIFRLKIINPKKIISIHKDGRYGVKGSELELYDYFTEKDKKSHFGKIWLDTLIFFGITPSSNKYDFFLSNIERDRAKSFVLSMGNKIKIGINIEGSFPEKSIQKKELEQIIISNRISFSFFSKGMKGRKNSIHSNFLSKIFSTKKNYLRGIKTCNIAFFRQDFINVNGFNNEFEGWGREDSELVVRLFNTGINRKSLRFNAIQYHLWHKDIDRKHLDYNNQLLHY